MYGGIRGEEKTDLSFLFPVMTSDEDHSCPADLLIWHPATSTGP